MGDRDDGHLVAALRAQAGEVRMQGMIRALRMVRGFTQHDAQCRRAALGDVAVGVAVARLVGGRHQAGIAGGVLRAREPVRSEEHTSELQSRFDLVCRLLLEKKNKNMLDLRSVEIECAAYLP